MKTGILASISNYKNSTNLTKNKIPEYAKDYKKEYLFIRGLNKEIKNFYNHLDEINNGLFKSKRCDRLCYLIKRFLRGQERGKLKDISEFMIPKYDYCYIQDFYFYYEIEFGNNPSYKEFFDLLGKLYNKIKIEFVFSDYYGEGYCI